jgi:hypothetical protein
VVGKARLACHHKLGLMQAMLSLVVDKHRAHHALLGCLQFVELRSTYREVNGRVKRVVAGDANTCAKVG